MSLTIPPRPTRADFRPQMAWMPVTGQAGWNCCEVESVVYGMEAWSTLQGAPPLQLSVAFLYQQSLDAAGFWGYNTGVLARNVLEVAQDKGVCAESVWPWRPDLATRPPTAAFDDALRHRLTGYRSVGFVADGNTLTDLIRAELAIGHPVIIVVAWYDSFRAGPIGTPLAGERPEGGHALCLFGYDDTTSLFFGPNAVSGGWFTVPYSMFDSPSGSRMAGDEIWPIWAITGVNIGAAPAPPPTGNTQMLTDIISIAQAALAANRLTPAQKDALAAAVAALVPDAAASPPPVVPPVVPPGGTSLSGTTVPPAASITVLGVEWTRGPHSEVLRDGVDAKGFYAAQILWTGVRIEAQNKDNGSWSFWNGNGWTWAGR